MAEKADKPKRRDHRWLLLFLLLLLLIGVLMWLARRAPPVMGLRHAVGPLVALGADGKYHVLPRLLARGADQTREQGARDLASSQVANGTGPNGQGPSGENGVSGSAGADTSGVHGRAGEKTGPSSAPNGSVGTQGSQRTGKPSGKTGIGGKTAETQGSHGTSGNVAAQPGTGSAPVDSGLAASGRHPGDTSARAPDTGLTDRTDTSSAMAPLDPCSRDSTEPWVYPDPSGGLHRTPVAVVFVPNKPCTIEWKWERDQAWRLYKGDTIRIDSTATIAFRAVDTCGKKMAERTELYEIKLTADRSKCPPGMEYVSIGTMAYCVDRYEWPNKRGKRPTTRITIYQAMDSCLIAGKRLCTTEEWQMACSGPYSWAFPYGQIYERHACVTNDTSARPAGSKPECRGYFGLFDMSGNVLEWTNTRATANNSYYNVMGGFWESGPQSGCHGVRYSYFPQNRHNPVGFRCCSDTLLKK
jgi:hypothetical protein